MAPHLPRTPQRDARGPGKSLNVRSVRRLVRRRGCDVIARLHARRRHLRRWARAAEEAMRRMPQVALTRLGMIAAARIRPQMSQPCRLKRAAAGSGCGAGSGSNSVRRRRFRGAPQAQLRHSTSRAACAAKYRTGNRPAKAASAAERSRFRISATARIRRRRRQTRSNDSRWSVRNFAPGRAPLMISNSNSSMPSASSTSLSVTGHSAPDIKRELEQRLTEGNGGHQEGDDVVDRERDQKQRKTDHGHARPLTGRGTWQSGGAIRRLGTV